jgi:hypothetical protein
MPVPEPQIDPDSSPYGQSIEREDQKIKHLQDIWKGNTKSSISDGIVNPLPPSPSLDP